MKRPFSLFAAGLVILLCTAAVRFLGNEALPVFAGGNGAVHGGNITLADLADRLCR